MNHPILAGLGCVFWGTLFLIGLQVYSCLGGG
jgi:hypothetical protein